MKDFNKSYDSLAVEAKKILEENTSKSSESEELDERVHPLLLSILKTAAIGAGKALLKGLLDKAEKQKISPRDYKKASSNFDKNGTLDKLKSADPRYRAAERGGRNPFERGTLAYELFNDLEEQTLPEATVDREEKPTEASKEILDEKLDKNMSVDEKAYWRVRELIDTLSKKADTLKKAFKSNKRIPNRLSKDMSVDEKAYWRVVDLIDTLSDTLKKKG